MNSFLVKVAFTSAFLTARTAALKTKDQVLRERSVVAPERPVPEDDAAKTKRKKKRA